MSVKEIDLVSFRNHAHINLKLGEGLNVIYGENGSGKTSILEAIYSLSLGRSFRTSRLPELVRKGDEYLSVKGKFISDNSEETIQLNQKSDGKRKIIQNGVQIKGLKELIGRNPVVLVSPEEQRITQGPPAERRIFFDRLFSETKKEYIYLLSDFVRVLKQRNTAIQRYRDMRTGKDEIISWDEPFSNLSEQLWSLREKFHKKFNNHLETAVNNYSEENLQLRSVYTSSKTEENIQEYLKKNINRDVSTGRTSIGPQKDNYQFEFQNRDMRQFGSQGEHKLALVLLKLAEFSYISTEKGKQPVMLLDDLFSKLDFKRSDDLLSLLDTGAQTIITTTDIVDIKRHKLNLDIKKNKTFHLVRNHAGTQSGA